MNKLPVVRALPMLLLLALSACTVPPLTGVGMPEKEVDLVGLNREAQLAAESGETAKAEVLYRSLVKRMPNDASTWLRLGNLYARNNKPDEAVGAYQRALIANNAESRAWYNLGVVRLRQAWAAMLQVQVQLDDATEPTLRKQAEDVLEYLEKLPFIEGTPRKAERGADAARY